MCGINGFNWLDEELIRRMNRATMNRGPDGQGVYLDEAVSLGHNRLSIIDLSENGRQPMANEDESIWLVFNGEVYNFQEIRDDLEARGHVFRSRTDTEVVIHAYEEYGLDCLNRFNGMWAFCLYDRRRNRLILCRDRFGVKPLYYYTDGRRLVFSSMIAGILAHGLKTAPNDRAIMEYLAFNLEDHGTETFFRGIHSLDRGGLMVFDLATGQSNISRWYEIRHREGVDREAIRQAFLNSVRLRTVADVRIGSCLSGGVDSSAIVCALDRLLDYEFYTFSQIAPGEDYDESQYIKEVGRLTKTRQFFTEFDSGEFLEDLDDFIGAQEEPVTSLSPYAQYRVMRLARRQGAKVLLDGQGGDEIFAGYTYFFAYYYYELLKAGKLGGLLKEMSIYPRNFGGFFPHAMLGFILLPKKMQQLAFRQVVNPWINHAMAVSSGAETGDPRWEKLTLDESLRLTLTTTAVPHLLRWEDKNSMRWGIESRVPFLDYELVESALSLPATDKIGKGRTKTVFKEAVADILPDMIANRRDKIGFQAPAARLLREKPVADILRGVVASGSFRDRPYWRADRVEEIMNRHLAGRTDANKTLWKCINSELWLRRYF